MIMRVFLIILVAIATSFFIQNFTGKFKYDVKGIPFVIDSGESVRIIRDFGGMVNEYKERMRIYKKEGKNIILDGVCISSCVYHLHSDYSLNVCITERARLGFHKPYISDYTGNKRENISFNDRIYVEYSWLHMAYGMPNGIKNMLANMNIPSVHDGDSYNDFIWIDYNILKEYYPRCNLPNRLNSITDEN